MIFYYILFIVYYVNNIYALVRPDLEDDWDPTDSENYAADDPYIQGLGIDTIGIAVATGVLLYIWMTLFIICRCCCCRPKLDKGNKKKNKKVKKKKMNKVVPNAEGPPGLVHSFSGMGTMKNLNAHSTIDLGNGKKFSLLNFYILSCFTLLALTVGGSLGKESVDGVAQATVDAIERTGDFTVDIAEVICNDKKSNEPDDEICNDDSAGGLMTLIIETFEDKFDDLATYIGGVDDILIPVQNISDALAGTESIISGVNVSLIHIDTNISAMSSILNYLADTQVAGTDIGGELPSLDLMPEFQSFYDEIENGLDSLIDAISIIDDIRNQTEETVENSIADIEHDLSSNEEGTIRQQSLGTLNDSFESLLDSRDNVLDMSDSIYDVSEGLDDNYNSFGTPVMIFFFAPLIIFFISLIFAVLVKHPCTLCIPNLFTYLLAFEFFLLAGFILLPAYIIDDTCGVHRSLIDNALEGKTFTLGDSKRNFSEHIDQILNCPVESEPGYPNNFIDIFDIIQEFNVSEDIGDLFDDIRNTTDSLDFDTDFADTFNEITSLEDELSFDVAQNSSVDQYWNEFLALKETFPDTPFNRSDRSEWEKLENRYSPGGENGTWTFTVDDYYQDLDDLNGMMDLMTQIPDGYPSYYDAENIWRLTYSDVNESDPNSKWRDTDNDGTSNTGDAIYGGTSYADVYAKVIELELETLALNLTIEINDMLIYNMTVVQTHVQRINASLNHIFDLQDQLFDVIPQINSSLNEINNDFDVIISDLFNFIDDLENTSKSFVDIAPSFFPCNFMSSYYKDLFVGCGDVPEHMINLGASFYVVGWGAVFGFTIFTYYWGYFSLIKKQKKIKNNPNPTVVIQEQQDPDLIEDNIYPDEEYNGGLKKDDSF